MVAIVAFGIFHVKSTVIDTSSEKLLAQVQEIQQHQMTESGEVFTEKINLGLSTFVLPYVHLLWEAHQSSFPLVGGHTHWDYPETTAAGMTTIPRYGTNNVRLDASTSFWSGMPVEQSPVSQGLITRILPLLLLLAPKEMAVLPGRERAGTCCCWPTRTLNQTRHLASCLASLQAEQAALSARLDSYLKPTNHMATFLRSNFEANTDWLVSFFTTARPGSSYTTGAGAPASRPMLTKTYPGRVIAPRCDCGAAAALHADDTLGAVRQPLEFCVANLSPHRLHSMSSL